MLKKIKLLCFFLPGFSLMAQFSGHASAMPGKEMQLRNVFAGSGYDRATSTLQTSDGGYMIAGITRSATGDGSVNDGKGDFWIIKFSSTKILQWQKTFKGMGVNAVKSIIRTADEDYMIALSTLPDNRDISEPVKCSPDTLILKIDINGNVADPYNDHTALNSLQKP